MSGDPGILFGAVMYTASKTKYTGIRYKVSHKSSEAYLLLRIKFSNLVKCDIKRYQREIGFHAFILEYQRVRHQVKRKVLIKNLQVLFFKKSFWSQAMNKNYHIMTNSNVIINIRFGSLVYLFKQNQVSFVHFR